MKSRRAFGRLILSKLSWQKESCEGWRVRGGEQCVCVHSTTTSEGFLFYLRIVKMVEWVTIHSNLLGTSFFFHQFSSSCEVVVWAYQNLLCIFVCICENRTSVCSSQARVWWWCVISRACEPLFHDHLLGFHKNCNMYPSPKE